MFPVDRAHREVFRRAHARFTLAMLSVKHTQTRSQLTIFCGLLLTVRGGKAAQLSPTLSQHEGIWTEMFVDQVRADVLMCVSHASCWKEAVGVFWWFRCCKHAMREEADDAGRLSVKQPARGPDC